ncbi:MAG: heterodisulfide reductase-related iron-sulfur binding cluster [Desulfotignum sp.]|nr:heterodisulfide reductase-related iron-sulfur binding cluster [Desulfotignum sp.]
MRTTTDFTLLMLEIFKKCAGRSGCGVCREHMEEDCLFFPEIYRLHDLAEETGTPPDEKALASLLDLCTLCGLCPCQDIRMLVLKAKAARAEEKKPPLSARLLSDARQVGHWGTAFSAVINPLNRLTPVTALAKKVLDIHPQRSLPVFPKESFFAWAQRRGLPSPGKLAAKDAPRVAYFVGCSAGYLFPDVAKAAVGLLEQNGIQVFVPSQDCCSMPLIMEGNQKTAEKRIQANLKTLGACVREGYDIVCSCPTCGYFFKKLLVETAYYSDAFQQQSGTDATVMKVPSGSNDQTFTTVPKSIYQNILKDNGYFSGIDPLQRIDLSLKVKDMGEYLLSLHNSGKAAVTLRTPEQPLAYFAPCHQREQGMGQPYYQLISALPGADIKQVGSDMQCCGMGGHLGFKKNFHDHSLAIGWPVLDKLSMESGRTLVTDCLSCRLQLQHTLFAPVFHPLEMLQGIREGENKPKNISGLHEG